MTSQISHSDQHPEEQTAFVPQRLALLLAGVCLLLSLVVAIIISTPVISAIKARNGQELAELAYHTAGTLDNGLYERFNNLLFFSQFAGTQPFSNNPALLRRYFDQQQQLFPEFAWIGFVRPDGTVLAGTGGLLEGKNILAREWVRAGQKGPFAGDVHEALLLSSLLPRPQSGEPLRLVDLSLPVHDLNNRLIGVLGAHLSWEWAKELRKNLLGHSLQGRQVDILILNKDGKVLLGSTGSSANGADLSQLTSYRYGKSMQEGFVSERWPDGENYVTGYARSKGRNHFKGLDWIVLVRQSEAAAAAELLTIRLKIIGLGALLGLVIALLSWLGTLRLLSPLTQLNQAHQGNAPSAYPGNPFTPLVRSLRAQLDALYEQNRLITENNQSLQQEVQYYHSLTQRLTDQRRSLELQIIERTQDLKDLQKKFDGHQVVMSARQAPPPPKLTETGEET